jgi:amino acid transporter
MTDGPAAVPSAPATLKAGSLHWLEVAALGIAIAISGNVSGWNYGLGVGGWGGMLIAALAMAVLFLCLTQSLAELAAALPEAGGFDGYVRRALGPTAAYLAGMSGSRWAPDSPCHSARPMCPPGWASGAGRSSSHSLSL